MLNIAALNLATAIDQVDNGRLIQKLETPDLWSWSYTAKAKSPAIRAATIVKGSKNVIKLDI